MSKQPSLAAALKRLDELVRWHQHDHEAQPVTKLDNPYARSYGKFSHIEDVALVVAALQLAADCAEHTSNVDMCPIFTMKLPCLWHAADKGFLRALSQCRGREAGDE